MKFKPNFSKERKKLFSMAALDRYSQLITRLWKIKDLFASLLPALKLALLLTWGMRLSLKDPVINMASLAKTPYHIGF
jgi:hypothetical protein